VTNHVNIRPDQITDTSGTGAVPIEIDGQPWTATPVEIDTDEPDAEGLRRSVERELSERADEDPADGYGTDVLT